MAERMWMGAYNDCPGLVSVVKLHTVSSESRRTLRTVIIDDYIPCSCAGWQFARRGEGKWLFNVTSTAFRMAAGQ